MTEEELRAEFASFLAERGLVSDDGFFSNSRNFQPAEPFQRNIGDVNARLGPVQAANAALGNLLGSFVTAGKNSVGQDAALISDVAGGVGGLLTGTESQRVAFDAARYATENNLPTGTEDQLLDAYSQFLRANGGRSGNGGGGSFDDYFAANPDVARPGDAVAEPLGTPAVRSQRDIQAEFQANLDERRRGNRAVLEGFTNLLGAEYDARSNDGPGLGITGSSTSGFSAQSAGSREAYLDSVINQLDNGFVEATAIAVDDYVSQVIAESEANNTPVTGIARLSDNDQYFLDAAATRILTLYNNENPKPSEAQALKFVSNLLAGQTPQALIAEVATEFGWEGNARAIDPQAWLAQSSDPLAAVSADALDIVLPMLTDSDGNLAYNRADIQEIINVLDEAGLSQ